MSHYKKLAGETLIYGLGTIVPRFLNFLVLTPFFTRVVLVEKYGIYSEIYAYSYLLLVILTFGTETRYFKFATDNNYKEKKVYDKLFEMEELVNIKELTEHFFADKGLKYWVLKNNSILAYGDFIHKYTIYLMNKDLHNGKGRGRHKNEQKTISK